MSRPRVTRGPIDDIAATVADLSTRLRNLETVGHRHPVTPYLPENSPRVYRSVGTYSIPNNTTVAIPWEFIDDNTWGAWSLADPTKLYAPMTGRYFAVAQCRFAPSTVGSRVSFIEPNGAGYAIGSSRWDTLASSANSMYYQVVSQVVTFNAGDYIELKVSQNSGGALSFTSDNEYIVALSLILLA